MVEGGGSAPLKGVNGNENTYVFPRHPSEIDCLDVQHYALLEAIGSNYLAPVGKPERILDVGAGTGQWAFDMAEEFPHSLVVGFDLVPDKLEHPANYRLVRGNLVQGLPFATDQFDFVHQRLLQSGVPLKDWSGVVDELVRVTRPGGWVELVEVKNEIEPSGPATRRLVALLSQLVGSLGLDRAGILYTKLDEYLRRAGLTEASRREIEIPTGEWGGRVGSLLASDVRAMFVRLCPIFQARLDVSDEECHELLGAMNQEWEENHSVSVFGVAFGRKPAA
jgi:ubiquinone/menaquinone biosynthesis C-methylase UbiE